MITQQDLLTLERLYTPLSKILLEHLRDDHDYTTEIKDDEVFALTKKGLVVFVESLIAENKELMSDLDFLKADYVKLQKDRDNVARQLHESHERQNLNAST